MNKWMSYYHPSTVVFVDDQQAFLNAVKYSLPSEMLALFFNDAREALNKIDQAKLPFNSSFSYIQELENVEEINSQKSNEAYFKLTLEMLDNTIFNSERFSQMSVVVVDRMMPNLDGISFCRQLAKHPIKKIMLTASKDCKIATAAFNEGIIDYFLIKDTPNLIPELITTIKKMQQNYFLDLNRTMLGVDLPLVAPLLARPSMIDFLKNKMMELNAAKFYLLDRWGSTLFIKKDGSTITLVISPAKNLDDYAEIAEEHEEALIAGFLSRKEKLLFFPQERDSLRPVKDWNEFLFDAQKVPDAPDLYFAVLNSLERDKTIFSHQSYLSNLT